MSPAASWFQDVWDHKTEIDLASVGSAKEAADNCAVFSQAREPGLQHGRVLSG